MIRFNLKSPFRKEVWVRVPPRASFDFPSSRVAPIAESRKNRRTDGKMMGVQTSFRVTMNALLAAIIVLAALVLLVSTESAGGSE